MLPLKLLLLVVFTFISSAVFSAQTEAAQTDEEAINISMQPKLGINGKTPELSKLKKRMAVHNIPAVSIAFMENHKITWTLSEGVVDFVSQREIDENTVFQTASISKPAYDSILLKYGQEQGIDLNTDANTLLKSRQPPKRKLSKTRSVTLRPVLSHSSDTTVHEFKPYAAEGVPSVVDVLKKTNLANTKTILNSTSIENSAHSQPFQDQLSKNDALAHRSIGLHLEGGADTYASLATEGLWITPSDLLTLASIIQKNHQDRDKSLTTNKTQSQTLLPQIESMGAGSFLAKEDGNVTSLSDDGINDGFSTHLFIHSQTGDGIAIMTNSDNGGELIKDLMPSINEVYGWKEFSEIEESAAVLEPELPQPIIDESEAEKSSQSTDETNVEKPPQSTVVLVAEGEQF